MIFKRNLINIFRAYGVRLHSTNEVRVRFAPSPTGYLHLGGLRTALYNYLFAKSRNGKFILRIEDTDQSRLVEGATIQLQKDLEWAGIKIDEGPKNDGKYGPYIQSERLNIYSENVQILLENKWAYPCFCTEKRLGLLRKEALRTRQIPKYDNRCRKMSTTEVQKRLDRKEQHCIRFKLSSDCETFEDMIYGNIAYDVALIEGDPVIIKADGYPTYHFANVVDDHFMGITHVLRGVEWQISTTKHILMYRAFNWELPRFGHLPLLLNSDGSKLSKRQRDVRVANYRDKEILPQALINYVTDCGGGFSKEQGLKLQSYTMDELISQFQINKVNCHSTKMMPEKLLDFNRLEIMKQVENEDNCQRMVKEIQELVKKQFPERLNDGSLQLDESYITSILKWSTSRINKLSDLISNELSFLWITPSINDKPNSEQLEIIKSINMLFKENDFNLDRDTLKSFLRNFATKKDISFSKLMQFLRTAISGLKEGPGVAEMIEILGKQNTIRRIDEYINKHTNR